MPITTQQSAWYFGIGLAGLALPPAIAIYSFHTSLGGRPLLGNVAFED